MVEGKHLSGDCDGVDMDHGSPGFPQGTSSSGLYLHHTGCFSGSYHILIQLMSPHYWLLISKFGYCFMPFGTFIHAMTCKGVESLMYSVRSRGSSGLAPKF